MKSAISRRGTLALPLFAVLELAGCGNGPEVGSPASSTGSDSTQGILGSSARAAPSTANLSIVDGCAAVRLRVGTEWGESCLPPSPRPRVAVSETIDGTELALLRFGLDVELTEAHPDDVRFEQADGWALVEGPSSGFTLTFRQGDRSLVCDYNPFFVECESA